MRRLFLGFIFCLAFATLSFAESVDINGLWQVDQVTKFDLGELGSEHIAGKFQWLIQYNGKNLVITQYPDPTGYDLKYYPPKPSQISITAYKYENNTLQFIDEYHDSNNNIMEKYVLKFDYNGKSAEGSLVNKRRIYDTYDTMFTGSLKLKKNPMEHLYSYDKSWHKQRQDNYEDNDELERRDSTSQPQLQRNCEEARKQYDRCMEEAKAADKTSLDLGMSHRAICQQYLDQCR